MGLLSKREPWNDRKNPNRSYEQLKYASAQARGPFDKDTWLNLAFYLDEQYVEWSDESRSIRPIPRKEGWEDAPRPVANKIMHFVNQEHSYALQDEPITDILPATDDPEDISLAGVALAYMKWLMEPQVCDWDNELSDAVMWALTAGEGYLKWIWNPRLKRPDILAVSPLDVFVDPYARKFKNARYVIHSQFMDPEQVFDIWGVDVKGNEQADPLRSQLLREMGHAPVVQGVTVNELWMLPNRRFEQGLYVIWAGNDQLVAPQPFPYKHMHLPFTQVGQIPRPGSQHFASAVKYLRSAQMELNKYHAQKIINRESFANGKWWIPSELELEAMPDDSPAQVLVGNSQGGQLKPELIQGLPFPDNQDGAWLGEEMMNIVGLHEVSQAQVPGRVEAAKAIEILKDADVSRQATLRRTIRSAISEGFWQTLMLAKQYAPEEQVLQVYSKDGMPEVRKFKAADFKNGMRVRVTMGTGLARSRAARQDQLLTYWQSGIIQDPEVMATLLDVPTPSLLSERAYDIKLARNENYAIAQGIGRDGKEGQAIMPNSWDEHAVHIKEHNTYRKTLEFSQLPTPIKQKFEFHVQMHEKMLNDQLRTQAMRAMIAQGANAQPAQSSAPAGAQGPGASDQPDASASDAGSGAISPERQVAAAGQ